MGKEHLIGRIIFDLRTAKGLTQEQLGQRLNVSAQAVSKWEKGDSLPDISLVVDLVEILGCTTDYLLGNSGNLESKIPDFLQELEKASRDQQILVLGKIMNTIGKANIPGASSHPSLENDFSLPFIRIDETGLTLWANHKFVYIATVPFLRETVQSVTKRTDFPLNIVPPHFWKIVFALLPDIDHLSPHFTVEESKLRSLLPEEIPFENMMSEYIDLGYLERVRGGYRLNIKAEISARMFAAMFGLLDKVGSISTGYSAKKR
ncbi:helix-turn-helix domain-containing protein [Paenibacillus ginsengarvi]|uniref:XRE family transcriptional regulator n=1 Tax=Paenibacillus ginsengarvi TaxID=400777 RepID=A0A3B0ARH5_9BACL|nr:helix-turn-helix transcriptional regulator [Paenibacillus ginsengarvi]RKN63001.1 XRE family transcriptional regulator [Paenibacillus ginsengarvi]